MDSNLEKGQIHFENCKSQDYHKGTESQHTIN